MVWLLSSSGTVKIVAIDLYLLEKDKTVFVFSISIRRPGCWNDMRSFR